MVSDRLIQERIGDFLRQLGKYSLHVVQVEKTEFERVKNALEGDGMVIASMGKGNFTGSGHFIVLSDYNRGKDLIYVLDPNSTKRSKDWASSIIGSQAKGLFLILVRYISVQN